MVLRGDLNVTSLNFALDCRHAIFRWCRGTKSEKVARELLVKARTYKIRGPFLESPETFRAHFGSHNSLCIFKAKASRGTKLCSYFNLYSLYKSWKDQLYRISGRSFTNGFSGSKSFRDFRETGPRCVNGNSGKVKKIWLTVTIAPL